MEKMSPSCWPVDKSVGIFFFLINDQCRRAELTLSGTTPGLVVSSTRKEAE